MSLFIKIIIIIMLLDPKNIVFAVLLIILMMLAFSGAQKYDIYFISKIGSYRYLTNEPSNAKNYMNKSSWKLNFI